LIDRGSVAISLAPFGAFSGTVKIGANSYPVSGSLNVQGAFNGVIGKGVSALGLSLRLNVTDQILTGTASVTGATLVLTAHRASFTSANPAPQALGRASADYVIALPHITTAGAPMGDGYGTVTVTSKGAVALTGTLGDGTALNQNATLGPDGEWPVYILLYHNAGLITGLLTISPDGVISGDLDWYKPKDNAAYYPSGFTLTANPTGQATPNPLVAQGLGFTPGTNLLSGLLPQETVALTGGGLASSVDITANITNGVGSATTAGFALSISSKTGRYTGKFLSGATSYPFNGVLIPANGATAAQAFGLFKGAPFPGKTNTPAGATGSVEF
jgi:hypothetical protein